MDAETGRLIGVVFACIGAVSTVLYYTVKFKELRLLRDIRDKMRPEAGR